MVETEEGDHFLEVVGKPDSLVANLLPSLPCWMGQAIENKDKRGRNLKQFAESIEHVLEGCVFRLRVNGSNSCRCNGGSYPDTVWQVSGDLMIPKTRAQ